MSLGHVPFYRNSFDPVDVRGVQFHRLLHPEGGIAGPRRVVLVSDRCPEECHDAVAYHLGQRQGFPGTLPAFCASAASGARMRLRARMTASPISRMSTSVKDGWREW